MILGQFALSPSILSSDSSFRFPIQILQKKKKKGIKGIGGHAGCPPIGVKCPPIDSGGLETVPYLEGDSREIWSRILVLSVSGANRFTDGFDAKTCAFRHFGAFHRFTLIYVLGFASFPFSA